jgi:aquaporin Z
VSTDSESQNPLATDKTVNRKYAAEFFATFILVFAGTGAAVANDVSDGAVTHVGVGLTFGLVVMALIYGFGDISGAHINPAVTIGFWAARRFEGHMVLPYIVSQLAGAFAASATLKFLFPQHLLLGTTLPAGSWSQSFILEVILTWILMFVILGVSTGAKEKGIMAGAAIGAVIAFEALFAGPISGASMNPARSLAPAIVSGHLQHVWVYVVAPIAGAVLAIFTCRCVQEEGCCKAGHACAEPPPLDPLISSK